MESKIKPGVLQIAGAFLAVYLIWGSTYLAIRFAIDTIPPLMKHVQSLMLHRHSTTHYTSSTVYFHHL